MCGIAGFAGAASNIGGGNADSVAEAMAAAFRESAGPEGVVAFPLVPDSRGVTLDAS